VFVAGRDVTAGPPHKRPTNLVFQQGALFGHLSVFENVAFGLRAARVPRAEIRRRVAEMLAVVDLEGLDDRKPAQLSGGQAQRVAIARAVALEPSLLVCDEPVSSLDVLIQAQVLNLFERLRRELNLSYLFIAHDLALVKQVSDRVAVMYLGKFCEVGPGESVYQQPLHPYTKALLDSIPSTEPGAARATATLTGEPPSPINPPSGCRFRTRCPRAAAKCASEVPEPRELAPNHLVACHFPLTEPAPAGPGISQSHHQKR
jgi:oligopeptide/dipeptide ABC transporter ATP-binding protein